MFPERFDKIIQFLPNGQSVTYVKGAGLQGITYLRNGETYVFISADDNDNIVCDGVVATTTTTTTSTTTTTTTTTTAAPATSLSFRNIVGDNGCNGSISEFPKCIPCSPTSSSHVVKTKEEDGVITFKVSVSVTNPNTSQLQYIWEYKSYTTECSSGDWTRFGTSNSSANQYGVTTVPTVDFNYNCVPGQSFRAEVRCTALMGWEDTRTISNSYYYKCENEIDTSELVSKFDLLISTPENASESFPIGFTTISRGFVLSDSKEYDYDTEQCEYDDYVEGGYLLLNQPSDILGDRNLLQLPFSESTKEAIKQIGKVEWLIRRPTDTPLASGSPSTLKTLPNNQRSFQTLSSTTALDNDNDPTTLNLASINFSSLYTGYYEIVAKVRLGTETCYSKIVPVFLNNYLSSWISMYNPTRPDLISLGNRSYQKHCAYTGNYPTVGAPSITADVAIINGTGTGAGLTGSDTQNVYVVPRTLERNYGVLEHLFPTSSVYVDGNYVTRKNLKVVYNQNNSLSYDNAYFIHEVSDSEHTNVLASVQSLVTSVWGFYDPQNPICAFGRYYPHPTIRPWNYGVLAPLKRGSYYSSGGYGSYPAQISDLTGGDTLKINLRTAFTYNDDDKPEAHDLVVVPHMQYSNDGGGTWRNAGGLQSVVKKNNKFWQATFRNPYSFGSSRWDIFGWRSGTLIRYTPVGYAGVLGGSYDKDIYNAGGYPGLAIRQLTDPSIPINSRVHSVFSQPFSLP